MKRVAPAQTRFLEREEVQDLFRDLPRQGRLALRDRALVLFLYNTGARVQAIAQPPQQGQLPKPAGHLVGPGADQRHPGLRDEGQRCIPGHLATPGPVELPEHFDTRQQLVGVAVGSEGEHLQQAGHALTQPGIVVTEQVEVGVAGRSDDPLAVDQRGERVA